MTLNISVLKSQAVTNPVAETSFAKVSGSANYAAECAKALTAVNDADGNPIATTYVKKSDALTRAELMEILAQYVTKTELETSTADVIGADEITNLFGGGN